MEELESIEVYAKRNKIHFQKWYKYKRESKRKSIIIAERTEKIKGLCICSDRLFDTTESEIHDTISGGLIVQRIIKDGYQKIDQILSREDHLYAIQLISRFSLADMCIYNYRLFEILYNSGRAKYLEDYIRDPYDPLFFTGDYGLSLGLYPTTKRTKKVLETLESKFKI